MEERRIEMKWMSLGILFLLAACSNSEQAERPDDSDRLYKETLLLVKSYNDSISAANDSASAMRAFDAFNAKLDSVNFSVAPDTDLLLTEGENDTIYMNLMSIKNNFEKKLESLDKNQHPDTCSMSL